MPFRLAIKLQNAQLVLRYQKKQQKKYNQEFQWLHHTSVAKSGNGKSKKGVILALLTHPLDREQRLHQDMEKVLLTDKVLNPQANMEQNPRMEKGLDHQKGMELDPSTDMEQVHLEDKELDLLADMELDPLEDIGFAPLVDMG